MGRAKNSIRGIYLYNSAAIDIHRKHDQLKPSLYFGIDLFSRNADESGGQISQELLEIHKFRVSSDFSGRSSCYYRAAVFLCGASNHIDQSRFRNTSTR